MRRPKPSFGPRPRIIALAAAATALVTSVTLAAEVTRSTDVAATPAKVWSAIGAFCAIKDWHPVVGTCTEDGKVPPTRTLVSKDGKATFVETQISRDDAKHTYSYNFASSPFPVSQYVGTISVSAKGKASSTVTWHGVYTPQPGKEHAANDAFVGMYESGLPAIKAKFAHQQRRAKRSQGE